MNKNLILIAKALSTHGLMGNLKLESFCENPTDIFDYNLYDCDGRSLSCKCVGKTSKNNVFLVKFDNINSIDEAKEFTNSKIFIDKKDLKETKENEIYINDLINMNVKSENKTGIIVDVYNYGAGDNIEIEWDDNKIESIPFTKDYIKNMDKENNILHINTPKYI